MKMNSKVREIIKRDLDSMTFNLNAARGEYHHAVEKMQKAAADIEIYEVVIAELRGILQNDDEIPNP